MFSNEETKSKLKNISAYISNLSPINIFEEIRNKFIINALQNILEHPDQWNGAGEIHGLSYREVIAHIESNNPDVLFAILLLLYRAIDLTSLEIIDNKMSGMSDFARVRLSEFSEESLWLITRALDIGYIAVKNLITKGDIKTLVDFTNATTEAKKSLNTFSNDLNDAEKRANDLKSKLEQYTSEYNFVLLNKGFSDLAKQKNRERKFNLTYLIVFGFLILATMVSEIYIVHTEFIKSADTLAIMSSIIPITSLLLILIYFFRITLANHRSILSQILQIKLRMTLCQFIQSYAVYAKEIKKDDAESLSKFENIIFSGIVADESQIPSTFDGLDSISNLIKSIKNS